MRHNVLQFSFAASAFPHKPLSTHIAGQANDAETKTLQTRKGMLFDPAGMQDRLQFMREVTALEAQARWR